MPVGRWFEHACREQAVVDEVMSDRTPCYRSCRTCTEPRSTFYFWLSLPDRDWALLSWVGFEPPDEDDPLPEELLKLDPLDLLPELEPLPEPLPEPEALAEPDPAEQRLVPLRQRQPEVACVSRRGCPIRIDARQHSTINTCRSWAVCTRTKFRSLENKFMYCSVTPTLREGCTLYYAYDDSGRLFAVVYPR